MSFIDPVVGSVKFASDIKIHFCSFARAYGDSYCGHLSVSSCSLSSFFLFFLRAGHEMRGLAWQEMPLAAYGERAFVLPSMSVAPAQVRFCLINWNASKNERRPKPSSILTEWRILADALQQFTSVPAQECSTSWYLSQKNNVFLFLICFVMWVIHLWCYCLTCVFCLEFEWPLSIANLFQRKQTINCSLVHSQWLWMWSPAVLGCMACMARL